MPDSVIYNQSPRASLSLLGLVASPIEMVRMYAHLRNNFAKAHDLQVLPSPLEWLRSYQFELLRQTQALFHHATIPKSIQLRDPNGFDLLIPSPTACTVGKLLQAQRICLGWDEAGGIAQDGQMLPLNTLLTAMGGPYQLSSSTALLVTLIERPHPLRS